ncbi:class I SAM-dependent methyltransferase [Chamaesiphon sp.]|uniref:class I SAM-dependent methyltransferase n=1 Tax=Chamaesiphon sp. TaxID=2814140 RepID=UPI003593322B
MIIQLSNCPVCDASNPNSFLHRNLVPTQQNLLFKSHHAATQHQRGELTLAVCHKCGFVFNQSFDENLLKYGKNYDNAQNHSPYFESYLNELTQYLIQERQVQNSQILEVGCGQGHFLRKLVELESVNNYGYGCDPSYLIQPDEHPRLKFEQRYYGTDCTHIPVDVVICRHVIEHVPNPVELLTSIRAALVNSPYARLFFETPCVEWILEHQVVWDFFYEHCSYFTAESLTTTFEQAGFEVNNVKHIFGRQYLWLEACISHKPVDVTYDPCQIPTLATEFAKSEQQIANQLKSQITQLRERGGVALWGAGAKGVTLANLIDPQRELISAVIDLNPHKHGGYLPGTGHPIINYLDLEQYGIRSAILMNPNYYQENLELLKLANIELQLID